MFLRSFFPTFVFKDFSIFSPGGHFVYRSESILVILVGSHLGNIEEKFDSHWPRVKEKRESPKEHSYEVLNKIGLGV